jgi:PST family polysaccharide transporter
MLMVGARLSTRLLDLVTMLVLARLLQPTDFGLVAIAASAVAVVETALDMPLNQALVRMPVISKAQYDTAFTLSVLRALVLTSILLLGAWPFAQFYNDPRLLLLVCVMSVGSNARGMTSPRLAEYQKTMSFWRDFTIELTGKGAGSATAVGLAILTGSYWSIAAGAVAYPLLVVIGSYCLAPYRPRLSLTELPVFSGFVGWMSAAQIVGAVNWQFERLFLGKLQTGSQIGLFSTASDMSVIPVIALFGPFMRPLLAAFTVVRNDQARLIRSYQTVSSAIVAIGLPLLVGECLLAEPVIRLIMGQKWLGVAPMLQLLSLSLIPSLFTHPSIPLMMSFGETKMFFRRSILELGVKAPIVIVGGMTVGFAGIALARLVSEIAAGLFSVFAVRRLVGIPVIEQLLAPWRSVIAVLVMAAQVVLCVRYIDPGSGEPAGAFQSAVYLVMIAALGVATYSAAMLGLWLLSGRPAGLEMKVVNMLHTMIAWANRPA